MDDYVYVFFDLETNGLNPVRNVILSAAYLITPDPHCVIVRGEEEKVLSYLSENLFGPFVLSDSSGKPMHFLTFGGTKFDMPFLMLRVLKTNPLAACWDFYHRLSFYHSDLKQFARVQTGSWKQSALEDVVRWYHPECELFWAHPEPRGWDDLSREEWARMSAYQLEEMRALVYFSRSFFPIYTDVKTIVAREVDLF